jgi:hypothetical protein
MKRLTPAVLAGLLLAGLHCSSTHAQGSPRVRYTLLGPSYFTDDCLICGRPTILEPLRGTFELTLVQDTPPYTRYVIGEMALLAGVPGATPRRITGSGSYERFDEFARLQDLTLTLVVQDSPTNLPAFFTNATPAVAKPFPLIEATLVQTNGTLVHTFTLHLLAAPVSEIWFSTTQPVISTNAPVESRSFSGGDFVSMGGRVIHRNRDLAGRLGVMPPVPDLGLDAVDLGSGGETFFSLPVDTFSETLGAVQHGDLLSSRGVIQKRNQELLAPFGPTSTEDAGLDGFQFVTNGELLFSVQSGVVTTNKQVLSRGDILSDQGRIYLSYQELMASFQPTTNGEMGVKAFRVLPSGEIWFSVREGFTDKNLGLVQAGDLLSSLGYRVFRNQDLVAAFGADDPTKDYGLDALWVVTDTMPAKPPPTLMTPTIAEGSVNLAWKGAGVVFQVERAAGPAGPWHSVSPVIPEGSWSVPVSAEDTPGGFFRIRQW